MIEGKLKKSLGVLFLFLLLLLIVLLIVIAGIPEWDLLSQREDEDHVLKIHSPLNERIIIPIIKEFQESTGIQVEYTSAGTLDLLKVLEEKDDSYLMDVMWGGSREYLNVYSDLFESVSIDGREESILGFNQLPIVLIYNKKLVSEAEICRSWKDILNPEWKGRLALADPEGSGSAYIALSFLLQLDTKDGLNWDYAQKLLNNVEGSILAKSSEVYEGVAAGDFAIGISMEEAAANLISQDKDIGIVYLEEGTPVIIDSIALMKDARSKEEARVFIDFVLSRNVQSYMVDRFYLRSIRGDVKVPAGLPAMENINTYDISGLTTFDKRESILRKWRSMVNHE